MGSVCGNDIEWSQSSIPSWEASNNGIYGRSSRDLEKEFSRGVFQTLSNTCDKLFLQKIVNVFYMLTIFIKELRRGCLEFVCPKYAFGVSYDFHCNYFFVGNCFIHSKIVMFKFYVFLTSNKITVILLCLLQSSLYKQVSLPSLSMRVYH